MADAATPPGPSVAPDAGASSDAHDFHVEDIPKLIQEPEFKAKTPEDQESVFDTVVSRAMDNALDDPTLDQAGWQAMGNVIDTARKQIGPTSWQQTKGLGAEAAQGVGGLAKDVAAIPGAVPGLLAHPIDTLSTVGQAAGYKTLQLGNSMVDFAAHKIPGTNQHRLGESLDNLKARIDGGDFPLTDPENMANWVQQQSKALGDQQWDANVGPHHSLASPENALLLGAYLRTRSPKVWKQLRSNMTQSIGSERLEHFHQDIANSPGAQHFDALYGKGASEHLINASDPSNYVMIGRAAKLARLGSRVSKVLKFGGEMAAFGVLNAIRSDPDANGYDISREALKSILTGGVIHVGVRGGRAVIRKVLGKNRNLPPSAPAPPETGGSNSLLGKTKGQEVAPPPAVSADAIPPGMTSLKKAVTNAERIAAGAEELPPTERIGWTESIRQGAAMLMADPLAGVRLVASLLKTPRPLMHNEAGLLLVWKSQLRGESDALRAQINDPATTAGDKATALEQLDENQTQQRDVDAANLSGGAASQAARTLAFQRAFNKEDGSLDSLRSRMQAAQRGRPLDAEQERKAAATHAEVSKAQTAADTATKAAEEHEQSESSPPVTEVIKRTRKGSKSDLAQKLKSAADAARARIKNRPIQTSTPIDAGGVPSVTRAMANAAVAALKKTAIGRKLLENTIIVPDWQRAISHPAFEGRNFTADEINTIKKAEGFFDPTTGKSVVIRDGIRPKPGETPQQSVRRVILHERVGHDGIDALREIDPKFDAQYRKIIAAIPADELAEIKRVYGDDTDRAVKEWFAKEFERQDPGQPPNPSTTFGKVWQAVKDFLARIFGQSSKLDQQVRDLFRAVIHAPDALDSRRGFGDVMASRPAEFPLDDYATIAASHIAEGITKTAELGTKMTGEFGGSITPHMDAIIAKAVEIVGNIKQEIADGAMKDRQEVAGEPITSLNAAASKLAKSHVTADESLTGSDPSHTDTLIARVQKDLKDLGHDLTPSETARAITGYGEQPEPRQTPVQKRLSELKAQILVDEKIADAMDNKVPWVRRIFRKPSDTVRRKLSTLRDEVRKITDEEVVAGRMKTAQQQREAQLENQIKDIEKQIATPGYKGRAPLSPLKETPRSIELKKRRDDLKAHLDDLRADDVKAERNRQKVALLRGRLDELLKRLGTGEPAEAKPKPEDSTETAALKGMIASVQAEIRSENRTMERSPTQEEIYNRRRIAAANASARHYQERTAKNQFRRELPKTHPLNAEAQKAVDEAMASKKAFDAAAEASGQRAEDRLARSIESMEKRKVELETQINSGVRPTSRGPLPFDKTGPEYRALKNELNRLNNVLKAPRLQAARDARAAAEAYKRGLDQQIASLARIVADAIRRGGRMAAQQAELARLRAEREAVDAPALERIKQLSETRTARYTQKAADVKSSGKPPVKKSRRQIELDAEARSKQADAARAKEKLESTIKEVEYAALPRWARGLRRSADFFREAAISGYHTSGKLIGFASLRQVDGAAKEMAGLLLSRLPYFNELMKDARFESAGETLEADAKARAAFMLKNIKTIFTKGLKEAGQQLWTGHHDTQSLYDKPRTQHQAIESRILSRLGGGSVHAAIKAPVIIGAHEANLARLESLGKETGGEVPKQSYAYSKRQALQEDNKFSAWIKQGMSGLERPDPVTGEVSVSKAAMAAFIKIFLTKDVVKVPSNWIAQIWEGLSGLPRAIGRTKSAFGRGLENVSEVERETTSRLSKIGTIGGLMLLWGILDSFRHPSKRVFGGFYEPGKRDEKDPAFGAMRLWGTSNSHWWAIMTHNPFAAIGQIGSTIGRAYQQAIHKHDSKAEAVAGATIKSALGLMESSPVGGSIMHLTQHHDAKSLIGDELRSLIPASATNLAQDQDPAKGRVKKTIGQHVQYGVPSIGIPGLPTRQELPRKH